MLYIGLDNGKVLRFYVIRFLLSKFGFSAMTFAHVGYITKFLWGQRHPPGDSEVE